MLGLALLGGIASGRDARARHALLLWRRLGRADTFDHGTEIVGQWQTLEFGIGRLADILEITPLVLGTESDGNPVRPGARGAPDAVDILFGHVGQLVIDHVADAGNVDPSRGHVGRDQHRRLGALELVERAFALRLALIAVDRIRLDASLRQLLHHAVAAMLGAREDQNALDLAGHLMAARQDQFEQALLLVLLDHEEILLDPFGGGAFGRHADLDRILAIGADQFLDLFRHGGAEEQRLALFRRELVDLAQRMDEAEVQHLVRFVQHQHFDAVQIERLLVDQVEQAARRRDENVGAAMQLVAVLVDRSAADDGMDLEARQRAVILGALGDLPGQFARRGEHQHAAGFERSLLVRIAQPVDAGQHEGGGLARAGLRDAEQVAA